MPDPPLPTETMLAGRYRLVRVVRRDSEAEIWEARDDTLVRAVAVHLGHVRIEEPGSRARFERSAAAARLVHPNIVATFDAGVDDGTAFLVTEPAVAPTAADLVADRGGALSPRAAVDLVAQAAAGLEHAHRAGVAHGRVVLGSIVCDDGRAKLGGFGLGPATADAFPPDDVRALGAVLYELLCGRPPAGGATTVPPRRLRAGIPRPLEHVVMAALAPAPGGYASAADLRTALLAVDLADDDAVSLVGSDVTPPHGTVPSFRRTERSWLAVAWLVIVVTVVAVVVTWALTRADVGRSLLPGRANGRAPGTSAAPPLPSIAAVTTFDPQGNRRERDDELPNLTDGDPSTVWRTERYNTPALGGLKTGVGLILRLDRIGRLGRLAVSSSTQGWSASVFVADRPADSLGGWGAGPVADRNGIDGSATFDLRGRRGGSLLLWITRVGHSEPRFSTAIGELRLLP